jgi:SAM-dependent methyltransferase
VATDNTLYSNRGRAEAFGSVAAAYDRYRPSYPDALVSDLVQLGPERALDVACGTGKVAVALLACGIAVLGVEVDPNMAAVARTHGLIVEVGAFETWDDDGRTFDLITCGQGWHWIDPAVGDEKAARLLKPGGTLALFWNYDKLDGEFGAEIDAVYQKHAPEIYERRSANNVDDDRVEQLKTNGGFASVTTEKYRWTTTLSTDEWIGRTGTYSDHILLPDDRREALFAALRVVIDSHGGEIVTHYRTYVILARTAER